ncbi:Bug family tripartite tricarboxylate transporter substrate binding protein [Hydrogenophaga sp. BPS33]|uniref:Bug family tripartite tricarboxylate transporter substrate binding protein n=1 Tax=Hydrogenophaga sp. BPS33 TaxID=2651974 RepID=UPI001320236E|nr:tripartite tricarboxylate transporter substrate binding protein [Hydrogenophaga sp. BPS33]QHE83931.1 tripartite tricarboxylate transporter substrate binding protein [Hydrogenophaga sp. BPS33]
MTKRRAFTLKMLMLLGASLTAAGAFAQASAYPNKPIKLIAGFAVGGPSDGIARAIAAALSTELGQTVVVENRTGAAGVVGMDALTASAPDGYTIGLLANTTTTALHFSNKPLDIPNRVTPVGRFVSTRIVLVVNPDKVPAKTLPEFVDFVRKHPGTTLTSAGHGGLGHLGLELFAQEQKLNILHVAYRGSAPALTDVIGGQVAGMVVDASSVVGHIASGRVRPIAVVSAERIPSLPNLPTALELGLNSLQIDSSMGIVLPPRTPQPIVDRLRAALQKAVNSASYTESAKQAGNAHFFEDAAGYRAWMEKDFARWGDVIRTANIKPQQ